MALPAGDYEVRVKITSGLRAADVNDFTVVVYAKDAVVIKDKQGRSN
jgi:hypothetical protein